MGDGVSGTVVVWLQKIVGSGGITGGAGGDGTTDSGGMTRAGAGTAVLASYG